MSWKASAHILVVEAVDDEREVLIALLERQGYHARGVRSGAEARAALEEERFDLLIVHRGLPDETGPTLLRDLRGAGRLDGVQAVIITGQPELAGEEGFPIVPKPVDPEALLRFVEGAVGRPEGPGPARTEGTSTVVELALYVSLPWPSSQKAVRNLQRVIDGVPPGLVEVNVYDMAREPERAERDRILFSPTLVKVRPEPRVWLLGDLSDRSPIVDLLESAGIEVADTA